ncbi:MAG TPA: hypothetical protein EYQ25_07795 [Planctomycetes bacterium]|nr:hypothetical protein [Planctomycetota bacterium]HIL36661.1 hypothetical protein [Planctomycetota bacterium]
MTYSSPRRSLLDCTLPWAALAALFLTAATAAQSPARNPTPLAIKDVTVEGRQGNFTLLLRDGQIVKIQAASEDLPAGYISLEGEGLHAAAAFMDASAEAGLGEHTIITDQDQPLDTGAGVRIEMRRANRKGIDPSWLASSAVSLDENKARLWPESGFSSLVAAPAGELLAGQSCLLLARGVAARDQVLTTPVFQHAAFRASGSGYPSTLMGYHAQLRQFFYDAERHRDLLQAHGLNNSGPRPPHDPNLEAAWPLLDGRQTMACAAESARDVHRWLKLADEFGLKIVIVGGREAWKMAEQLKASGTAVILTLDWPEEVDDPREDEDEDEDEGKESKKEESQEPEPETPSPNWEYEEPVGYQLDKRLRWEEMRDSAIRLSEAGVVIAFGSGGDGAKQLLKRVTELVENGLSRDVALASLGTTAAALVGGEQHLGGLAPGSPANLCLWSAPPLTEDAAVRYAIIDGHLLEFEVKTSSGEPPAEGVDLTGRWAVTDADDGEDEEDDPMELNLIMDEDGSIKGSADAINPMDGSELKGTVTGSVHGDQVEIEIEFQVGPLTVIVQMEGEWDDGTFAGSSTLDLGGQQQESSFQAARIPDRRIH